MNEKEQVQKIVKKYNKSIADYQKMLQRKNLKQ